MADHQYEEQPDGQADAQGEGLGRAVSDAPVAHQVHQGAGQAEQDQGKEEVDQDAHGS